MNTLERLQCILYINPSAKCVVWEDGMVTYDPAHTGKKPTEIEISQVLADVQKANQDRMDQERYEKMIDEEKSNILEEQAIQNLKDSGKLPSDFKK